MLVFPGIKPTRFLRSSIYSLLFSFFTASSLFNKFSSPVSLGFFVLCLAFSSSLLEKNGIFYEIIGKTQEDSLDLDKELNIKLNDLYELNSFWFRNFFKEN